MKSAVGGSVGAWVERPLGETSGEGKVRKTGWKRIESRDEMYWKGCSTMRSYSKLLTTCQSTQVDFKTSKSLT